MYSYLVTPYIYISIILVLVIWLMWSLAGNAKTEKALQETRDRLMSLIIGKKLITRKKYLRKEELEYLGLLESTFGDNYIVKSQIHLSDIADIKFGYYDHDNLYYDLKRIILDYVIFDKEYVPLVGVELNGSSHFLNNRLSRDRLTENLLHNIGVEYHELDLSKKYNISETKTQIEKKIELVKQKLVSAQGISV